MHRCCGINRHLLLEDDVQQRAEPIAARRNRGGPLDLLSPKTGSAASTRSLGETFRRIDEKIGRRFGGARRAKLPRLRLSLILPFDATDLMAIGIEPPARLYIQARGGGLRVSTD